MCIRTPGCGSRWSRIQRSCCDRCSVRRRSIWMAAWCCVSPRARSRFVVCSSAPNGRTTSRCNNSSAHSRRTRFCPSGCIFRRQPRPSKRSRRNSCDWRSNGIHGSGSCRRPGRKRRGGRHQRRGGARARPSPRARARTGRMSVRPTARHRDDNRPEWDEDWRNLHACVCCRMWIHGAHSPHAHAARTGFLGASRSWAR